MTASLPEWCSTVAGFDPESWWRPIVCTGRGVHRLEFLGLIFDHAESGQVHWTGGQVLRESDPGVAGMRLWQTDETTPDELDHIRALNGQGSMHIRCPQGCTPRIPREEWGRIVERVRRVEVAWLDVSLYG